MAAERIDHEIGRRLEDARLGAAKAVEALLRVADDERARRLLPARAAAGPGIRRRARHAARAIAAGWCPGTRRSAGGARAGRASPASSRRGRRRAAAASAEPFEIGHVGEAMAPLVVGMRGEQRARAGPCAGARRGRRAGHLLVQPRQELAGLGQCRRLGQVLAHRALLGEQGRIDRLETRARGRQARRPRRSRPQRRAASCSCAAARLQRARAAARAMRRHRPAAPGRRGPRARTHHSEGCLDAALERAGRIRLGNLHRAAARRGPAIVRACARPRVATIAP